MKIEKETVFVLAFLLFYLAFLLTEYQKYGVFWDEGGHLDGAYFIYYGIKDFVSTASIGETIGNLGALSHQYNSFSVFYYPPLFFILNALTFFIVGVSPFAGRLVSMIFGVLTIYFTYRLGERVYNKRVGLLAAIFLGASALFFRYALMAMFDIATAFFFTLSIFCFLLLMEKRIPQWVFGVVVGIGLLHRYELILILPICIAYLIFTKAQKGGYGRFLAGFAIAIVIASLWAVPTLLRTPDDGARPLDWWIKNLGRHNPSAAPMDFLYLGKMLFPQMSWIAAIFGILGFLKVAIEKRDGNQKLLLLCWIAVIYVFFSIIPNRLPRYTLSFLPAFAILGANFVQWASDKLVKFPKNLFLALTVLIVVLVSYTSYENSIATLDYELANYQYLLPIEDAAKYIVEKSSPGDMTLMASFRNEVGPGTLAFYMIKNDEENRKTAFTNIQSYGLKERSTNMTQFKAVLRRDCPRFVVLVEASEEYSNEDSRMVAGITRPYNDYIKTSGTFSLDKTFTSPNAGILISVYERTVKECNFY